MERMVFRPVSDIDVSNIGDWEKSNSKMSCAAALVNLDDEYIYMRGRETSTGNIKLQLGLDESTRPNCFSFHITNIGVEGIYSSGKNLTTGTIDTTLDLLSNSFTNSTGTSKLEYQISLDSNQTNARIAANYSRYIDSSSTDIDELRDFGPMTLQISGVHSASSSAKSGAFSLDQLFIYVDYEPVFLSVKQGGTWVECSNVYQKVNGIWVEQDVDFLGRANKMPAFQTFTHQVGPILPLSPVFSENSWEDIATACEFKMVPTSWKVGDSKMMTIDGVEQQIDIIGRNHDIYEAGGIAPLTFQLHNCLTVLSERVVSVDKTIMPDSLQSRLKPIIKRLHGHNNTKILFVPSETEIGGNTYSTGYTEGTRYEYYAIGNSRIKRVNGEPVDWWLSSFTDKHYYAYIDSAGNWDITQYYEHKKGVSFGFCF